MLIRLPPKGVKRLTLRFSFSAAVYYFSKTFGGHPFFHACPVLPEPKFFRGFVLKRHNEILITLVFTFDLLLAYAAWDLAYYLRFFGLNLPAAQDIPAHAQYLKAVPVLLILTAVVFVLSGVYRSEGISRFTKQFLQVLKASFWLLIGLLAIAFFYRKFSYSRIHVLYFISLFMLFLMCQRYFIQRMLHFLHKRGWHVSNIAVVGTSARVQHFVKTLHRYQSSGMVFCGTIGFPHEGTNLPEDSPYLGDITQLESIVQQHQIHQVFIAVSQQDQVDWARLYDVFFDQMVDIKIIPELGPFKLLHTDVERFDDIPIVTVIQSPLTGWNGVLKRSLDVGGALGMLLLFSPVMFFISLFIKWTSPGPIFYKQERMGLDGVTFQALKFRSMHMDSERESGAVWAKAEDDRRTRFGTILRQTSLDELPQLFNILKGEMSLVGPRPERPVFIKDFKKKIPNYMLRHKVKAGLTGWAQINGWRGNTSLEKRIECDLYYIEHWSIWFDLKILFLTLFKGFVHPNAY